MKTKSAVRIIVSSLGVLIGATGIINHGFFELIQGNRATTGLIINSVGKGNFIGAPAGEEALSLIPNFLLSGIATILVCSAIIVWSIKFIHIKNGSKVFLLLCTLQMLTGGGIAQIVFVLITWITLIRADNPFKWQINLLTREYWKVLSAYWRALLITGIVIVFVATQIALYQVFPGISNPGTAILISLIMLVLGIIIFIVTILAGFAYDIHRNTTL